MSAEIIQMPLLDEAIVTAAEQTLSTAKAYAIANADQYVQAGDELKRIKSKAVEIEQQRVNLKAPALEAGRRIDEFFKKPLDFLRSAEAAIKRAMVGYVEAQEAKQREEQARADEAARKEREKIEQRAAAAAESGKVERAEALQQQASTVVAPVIVRAPPKIAGVSFTEVPKFEVTDASLVPREYLSVDEKKIRGVVNALKMNAKIPGVRVWLEKQPSAKAG